jgi:hypothetical protein
MRMLPLHCQMCGRQVGPAVDLSKADGLGWIELHRTCQGCRNKYDIAIHVGRNNPERFLKIEWKFADEKDE